MSYIERQLDQGERVIRLGRVSWWTLLPRTLLAIAVLVVAVVVGSTLGALSPLFWLIAIGALVVVWIAMVIGEVLRVLSTEIAVTDRRVISKTGILRTEVKSTPLEKVNNINVARSLFGNLLDYGDIEITTATAEEEDNHLVSALEQPDKFRNALTEVAPH